MPDSRPQESVLAADDLDALLSRLEVMESQPLAERAAAFAQLHDELRAALERADASA